MFKKFKSFVKVLDFGISVGGNIGFGVGGFRVTVFKVILG